MSDHCGDRLWRVLDPLCEDRPLAVQFLWLLMLRVLVFDGIFLSDRRQHLMHVECLLFPHLLFFLSLKALQNFGEVR